LFRSFSLCAPRRPIRFGRAEPFFASPAKNDTRRPSKKRLDFSPRDPYNNAIYINFLFSRIVALSLEKCNILRLLGTMDGATGVARIRHPI
jgi:hypothetical protein